MNVRRFTARTTREAMAKVREALGDDAVVLKNRSVDGGVEIMAMSDEQMDAPPRGGQAADGRLQADTAPPAWRAMGRRASVPPAQPERIAASPVKAEPAPSDEPLPAWAAPASAPAAEPMSTLTFQQFVRDRLARRRATTPPAQPAAAAAMPAADPAWPDEDLDQDKHPMNAGPLPVAAAWPATAGRTAAANAVAALPEPAAPVDAPVTAEPVLPAPAAAPVMAGTAAPSVVAPAAAARGAVAGGLARARSALDGMTSPDSGAARLQQAREALAQTKQRLAQAATPAVMRAGRAPPAEPVEPSGAGLFEQGVSASDPARFGIAEPAPSLAQVLGNGAALPGQTARPGEAPAVMAELREMRGLISSQLSSLAWLDGVRRNPLQVRLLRKLIGCGLSAQLARKLVSRVPAELRDQQAEQWVRQMLGRLMRCDVAGSGLLDRGGMYALVGPTGVGKTTSAAKIAAQFALRHGVQSVGLLTVDAYRIGAQDQLRTFGRLLGVPVHVAHDAGALAEFLHLFMNKKLVLIDTVGVGQRDERVNELLSSLGSDAIKKLVVLNASAQAETIEDVITAYRADHSAGVVLSKIDEAVKTGGVLDCVIRHRLQVVGVANGQRVPEDWGLPDPTALIDQALAERPNSAFDLDDNELAMLLAPEPMDGMPMVSAERGAMAHV